MPVESTPQLLHLRRSSPRKPKLHVGLDWGHAEAWESGYPDSDTTGMAWGDIDGDGWDDLVEVNDGAPNRIWFGTQHAQEADRDIGPYDQTLYGAWLSTEKKNDFRLFGANADDRAWPPTDVRACDTAPARQPACLAFARRWHPLALHSGPIVVRTQCQRSQAVDGSQIGHRAMAYLHLMPSRACTPEH